MTPYLMHLGYLVYIIYILFWKKAHKKLLGIYSSNFGGVYVNIYALFKKKRPPNLGRLLVGQVGLVSFLHPTKNEGNLRYTTHMHMMCVCMYIMQYCHLGDPPIQRQ